MILVTAATDWVSQRLIQSLVAQEHQVRVLVPDTAAIPDELADLNLHFCTAHLHDATSLSPLVQGCEWVMHTAHHQAANAQSPQECAHLIMACKQNKVKRLLHVSSLYGLGYPTPDGMVGDESTPFNWEAHRCPQSHWTYLAEQEMVQGSQQGLDIVIVHLAEVWGAGTRDSNRDFYFQPWTSYPHGGTTIIDIEAAMAGIIAAAVQGTPGERYILGGPLVMHKEIFDFLARMNKQLPPLRRAPAWQWHWRSWWHHLLGLKHGLTPEKVERLTKKLYYRSDKAIKELQLPATDFKRTLRETVE